MYWNDAFLQLLPWFKPTANRLQAWEQTNSAFPTSFSQFHPRSSPPPPANEMCQSQDVLLAAGSTASLGQVRSKLLPISLAGNQECPPPPPPSPPPPPLLPFLMAHTKHTRRSVTASSSDHEKTATNFPRGGGLCLQMFCICVFSICACQAPFLQRLNVTWGRPMSPEVKVSCRVIQCFHFAHKNTKRQDSRRFHSHVMFVRGFSYVNYWSESVARPQRNLNAVTDKWKPLCHETVSINAQAC